MGHCGQLEWHICDKLIDRHPHIYGDVEANDEKTVKANWEQLKLKEGKKSVLEGVPKGLPSLVKAYRIQDKVRGVGFDWEHAGQVWDKVQEELAEFQAEVDVDPDRAADEFGDVLFALVNYARFKDINPDEALERTNRRFQARFQHMESAIQADVEQGGKTMAEMSLTELILTGVAQKRHCLRPPGMMRKTASIVRWLGLLSLVLIGLRVRPTRCSAVPDAGRGFGPKSLRNTAQRPVD